MRYVILSACWWTFLALLTFALVPLTLALCVTIPFDRRRRPHLWESRLWCRTAARACPTWRVDVTGLENLQRGRHYVVMSNHESFADILLLSHLPILYRWVSKREVFLVPFFGWQMWVFGHLSVKRGSKTSVARFMTRARRTIEMGLSVLIFPEGTRSRTGDLGTFKPGGFQLASETGVAVLPVAIGGTRNALPKNTWVVRERAYARLHVCPPIDVVKGEAPEGISARVREAILAEHARVHREAGEGLARWLRESGAAPPTGTPNGEEPSRGSR
ncbi:MAG: lysophospholipid acyltransferase family protein [Myxococcota bacterium]|nr:lysophospholipid acyltransferase family protein [Myxococcota bacterium]